MPLLGIATAQPSFENGAFTFRAQTLFHNKFVFSNEKMLAPGWKSFKREKKFDSGRNVIRAVATLEPVCSVQSNGGQCGPDNPQPGVDSGSTSGVRHQSLSDDSEELDEREKLRRMRISKANKGNTPWNKGRKHSAETLQRIRERTWIAMQDPKVKRKLANAGHAQSEETRMKIGVGVRMGWERHRQKLMLRETCYFEWQNLIAEASRKGLVGEEELRWDSYKILEKQLKSEWLEKVEQTKNRPKGNKRAPKSLEQRRKISEAISAKWADPAYRERVCSALGDYYGTPAGAGRNLHRRLSGERQSRTERPIKKKAKDKNDDTKSQNRRPRFKRSNVPPYKDPLASSKLEMIKNIRAKRAAAETKKTDAISQARLLIAEAEKAATALEAAAMRNPLARASLNETRELIAEAIQSIQSIENEQQIDSHENDNRRPSIVSSELNINNAEEENNPGTNNLSQTDHRETNGVQAMESSKSGIVDFGFGKFDFQHILDDEELHQTGASELQGITIKQPRFAEQLSQIVLNGKNSQPESLLLNGADQETPPNSVTVSKKWVCGRLVEMVERA